MNSSKAQEFFSDYYEGTLNAGLTQSLEQAFARDVSLRAQYDAFVSMMETFDEFALESIEVPQSLSDRIATRLEAAQEKRSVAPAWIGWFRNLALGGIATAIVFGTVAGILSKGGNLSLGNVFGGGIERTEVLTEVDANTMAYVVSNGTVQLQLKDDSTRDVIVNGQRIAAGTGGLTVPLANRNAYSAAFSVQLAGVKDVDTVVVPGTVRREPGTGTGNIEDFAKALADRYGIPVRVQVKSVSAGLHWALTEPDAYACATTVLQQSSYAVKSRRDGFIIITGG